MPIRQARFRELDAIVTAFAEGFYDEEVNGDLLHPYRKKYYLDYINYWRRKCDEKWWDYSRVFLVSFDEVQDGDEDDQEQEQEPELNGMNEDEAVISGSKNKQALNGIKNKEKKKKKKNGKTKEVVTGVAEWCRTGSGWEKLWGLYGWWDPRRLLKPLVALFHNIISNTISPNRAAARHPDLTPEEFNAIVGKYTTPFFTKPAHRQTNWTLSCLSVRPEYRGRGHGKELAAWGVAKAKEEGIPAGVVSAKDKEAFYSSCGFTELVGWATKGEGNPLKGNVDGGAIMFSRVKEDDELEAE